MSLLSPRLKLIDVSRHDDDYYVGHASCRAVPLCKHRIALVDQPSRQMTWRCDSTAYRIGWETTSSTMSAEDVPWTKE